MNAHPPVHGVEPAKRLMGTPEKQNANPEGLAYVLEIYGGL
jgi:hypothetical protein